MVSRPSTTPGRWLAFALPALIPFVILVCNDRSANEKTYPAMGVAINRYASSSSRLPSLSGAAPQLLAPPQHRFPRAGDTVATSQAMLYVEHVRDSNGQALTCEFAVYADPELRDLVVLSGPVQPGLEYTSWVVPSTLPAGRTFWWRARTVSGANAGKWSIAQIFFTMVRVPDAGPSAKFSVSAASGCAPFTVTCFDESSGEISSYDWDFGDGHRSHAANPSHQYVSGGVYTIELTVTGRQGVNTSVFRDCVTVTSKPVASFTASGTRGVRPHSVQFVNQSSDAEEWRWDFGDGGWSMESEPRHTYTAPGTYTVTLTATGACGSARTIARDYITTDPCQMPSVDFDCAPANGVAPLAVDFTQQTHGAQSWSWDFGDGNTSSEENPTHRYAEVGTYTVTLAASNDCGCEQKASVGLITVTETPLERLHVGALNVTTRTWEIFLLAEAKVRVVDGSGDPVAGATVIGHWSDKSGNTCTFTSGTNGWGSVLGEWGRSDASITFCVDKVEKKGWLYDRTADELISSVSDGVPDRLSGVSIDDIAEIGATIDRPLAVNFPNPFNAATEIHFFIPEPARVTIEIYNSIGRKVKHLFEDFLIAGMHANTWDGTGDDARPLASGIYFYRIIMAGREGLSKKMVMMK